MTPLAKKFGRYLIGSIVVAALAGSGWMFFFDQEKPKPIITTKVTRMDMQESVLATGTLEAFKMVSVGAQVSGQIKSLKVALGDKVAKDQLIAEIDSMTQQNELRNAEASLENVKAQHLAEQATFKQAQAAYLRQKTMRAHDAVSKESFQSAEANFEASKANLQALEARIKAAEITLDTAKVNLGYTNIIAPMDGTVVAIVTEEGQTVNAAQQAPTIIKLAQLDTMTIKAQISEADITRVQTGQNINFTILGEPAHVYQATLRAIEPAPETIGSDSSSSGSSSSTSSAIYYNGLFDVPNEDGKLRISMTAEVNIILNEAKNALSIPRTALGNKLADGRHIVRIKTPTGQEEERKVKTGLNDGVNVQIIEGLKEGEDVIVSTSASKDGESTTPLTRRPGMMRL